MCAKYSFLLLNHEFYASVYNIQSQGTNACSWKGVLLKGFQTAYGWNGTLVESGKPFATYVNLICQYETDLVERSTCLPFRQRECRIPEISRNGSVSKEIIH